MPSIWCHAFVCALTALATPGFDWHAYCESIVTAPVLDDGELLRASCFDRVLTEGFKLTWRSPAAGACQVCEASNSDGFCGYSTNGTGSQEFFCTCPVGRHSISCYGDGNQVRLSFYLAT